MSKDVCCSVTAWEKNALKKIPEYLEEISSHGGPVLYRKGHVLFYEGHSPYGLYILKKGEIQLTRANLNGQKEILPNAEKNLLGLFHLITNTSHCATAQAKTDVEILFIPKSLILEYLGKN